MSGWMSYFTGKPKDSRQSARDSIVGLRSQLLVLDKREEFLQKKIEEELKKAKTNATANKRCEYLLRGSATCTIDRAYQTVSA